MPISRTRLRLALWFAASVLLAVSAADVALYLYLRSDADQKFTRDLTDAAQGLLIAIRRERIEMGGGLEAAATDALAEWPDGPTAFAVYGPQDAPLGTRGEAALLAAADATWRRAPGLPVWQVPRTDRADIRLARAGERDSDDGLRVVAAASTHSLRAYEETLLGWLTVSVPVVTLFALLAGYLLARRALRPVDAMGRALAEIAPEDLDRRLPVRHPADELDRLAEQFNHLLARLAAARDKNRAFLSHAAHQLRTPLTVVRGESALGLERPRTVEAHREILQRVRRAAEQMSHRVEELFLLAQAEAGDLPALDDEVELDGVALECADLMRGRAQLCRRTLELARVEPVQARGNEQLLREALVELIENALRHGAPDGPVRISGYPDNGHACLEVASRGPALDAVHGVLTPQERQGETHGLAIVRWIADVHHGQLHYAHSDQGNRFVLRWPVS